MNFLIILKVALRSLRRTALRSSLTALGIIIGIASVIALLAIGNGAKALVEAQMAGMDRNSVVLVARMKLDPTRPWEWRPPPLGRGLNLDDYDAIRAAFGTYAHVNVELYPIPGGGRAGRPTLRANGHSSPAQVVGTDALAPAPQRTLVSGTLLTREHIDTAASVCVVTQTVANSLFPNKDPLDQVVIIQNAPFRIAGIIEDFDFNAGQSDTPMQDLRVHVPYTSALRRLNRSAIEYITIIVRPTDPARLLEIQRHLGDLMETRRGTRTCEFVTGNIARIAQSMQQSTRTLALLLVAIGAISLIVGGVGIMNIMLVSVTERTREIGIRLAIGTRDRDILRQFLIEAVILSALGGLIGIALGIAAAQVIGKFGEMPIEITIESVLTAFLCSAAIGIFFGWYPARQAARLDPIEALRAE